MKDVTDLAELIYEYGPAFYGPETPEYIASQWAETLPNADLAAFHEWFNRGFFNPAVARELSNAGVFPWEVPAGAVYDMCNGDLKVSVFLRGRI